MVRHEKGAPWRKGQWAQTETEEVPAEDEEDQAGTTAASQLASPAVALSALK